MYMTALESRIATLLDEGKDANAIITVLDDEVIFSEELARRLLKAGADVNELARVAVINDERLELEIELLQAGADVDWLVERIGVCAYLSYDDKISEMMVAMVRHAADHGVKPGTIMRLMGKARAYAQDIFRQVDYLYERGCKIDIDECLKERLVSLGRLEEDIAKVIDVGYPPKKIVRRCMAECELSPSTVVTLAARGVDISEIIDDRPWLAVECPKQFGKMKNLEVLYTYLEPDSNFDVLIGELGMDPIRAMKSLRTHQGKFDPEPLLRNGLKPKEYAEFFVQRHETRTIVENFRVLKQYDPEFDLEPEIAYDIWHEDYLEELLDCKANRTAVVGSAIWYIQHYGTNTQFMRRMLGLATAEEVRLLLDEASEDLVARCLAEFINHDELKTEDITKALEKARKSKWGIAIGVIKALPTLCAREIPLERDVLEEIVRCANMLSEEEAKCLVKYGVRPSELVDHMKPDAIKANIEALVDDGCNPDRLAMLLAWKGLVLDEETCARLKKVGAKIWV